MKVKVLLAQAVDRCLIESEDSYFSWEGETPQCVALRLGDRSHACFEARFAEDGGRMVLELGEEVAGW